MRGVAGGFHFDRTDFLLFDSHKVNFVFLFAGSSFRVCTYIHGSKGRARRHAAFVLQ